LCHWDHQRLRSSSSDFVPAFRLPTVGRHHRSHVERPASLCHLSTISAHLKKTTETVSLCGPCGSSCYLGHLQNFLIDWLMLWLHVGRWSRWPWWVVRVSAEKQGHARRITRQTNNIWQWQWLDVSSLSPGLRQLLTIVTDLVGCVHNCAGAATAGPISGPRVVPFLGRLPALLCIQDECQTRETVRFIRYFLTEIVL